MINNNNNKINISWFIIIVFSTIFILACRLFYLQFILTNHLEVLSEKNFARNHDVKPFRGLIVDSQNRPLASNQSINNLIWQGTGQNRLTEEQKKLIKKLEEIIELINKENISVTEKYSKELIIAKNIPRKTLFKILQLFSGHPNLKISNNIQREYPHGCLASHIIGYLGLADSSGKMGLERICESLLAGSYGKNKLTINAFGALIDSNQLTPAKEGENIKITININLQQIAEELFPVNISGAMILMDPTNGDLCTVISRPNFDPNLFLEPITNKQWQELTATGPFINRAFNATYPPASLFKLITIAAALEEGIITTDQEWTCYGYTTFAKRRYHCSRHHGHGRVNTKQALAHSCNIPFFNIAQNISIDTLSLYAHKFGLGEPTGIFMDEKSGLIPNNKWKIITKKERWWPGETLSAVIGQSYLLVTPIQMARMVGGIVEGYLVKPRLLTEEPIIKNNLNISLNTRNFLLEAMKTAITIGTGKRLNKIKDITVYAKTGTAQTSSLEKRDQGQRFKEHTWFIGSMQYQNAKPLVIVTIFEHCGDHKEILSFIKKFLMRYRSYCSENKQ